MYNLTEYNIFKLIVYSTVAEAGRKQVAYG